MFMEFKTFPKLMQPDTGLVNEGKKKVIVDIIEPKVNSRVKLQWIDDTDKNNEEEGKCSPGINPHANISCREFMLTPIKDYLSCNILVKEGRYHVYMHKEDRFLMSAKKLSGKLRTNFVISSIHDSFQDNHLIGRVNSNLMRKEYIVYDMGDKHATSNKDKRKYLAQIVFPKSVINNKACKHFVTYTPSVKDNKPYEILNLKKGDKPDTRKDLVNVYKSKNPKWNECNYL